MANFWKRTAHSVNITCLFSLCHFVSAVFVISYQVRFREQGSGSDCVCPWSLFSVNIYVVHS